jgi:hypothetical protein
MLKRRMLREVGVKKKLIFFTTINLHIFGIRYLHLLLSDDREVCLHDK